MHRLAVEKQRYYESLQTLVINRYEDQTQIAKLVESRMEKSFITTYLSLKGQLKKK